jgi:hypothetical protein
MFKRLPDEQASGEAVTILFEGKPVVARAGDSVAAALAAQGVGATRTTPRTGAPRAAYCMMGACFDCLVVVDGKADRQGCLVEVREGMAVQRQRGGADLA